jgi:hypothetical protein
MGLFGAVSFVVAATTWRGFRRLFEMNLYTVRALGNCSHLHLWGNQVCARGYTGMIEFGLVVPELPRA